MSVGLVFVALMAVVVGAVVAAVVMVVGIGLAIMGGGGVAVNMVVPVAVPVFVGMGVGNILVAVGMLMLVGMFVMVLVFVVVCHGVFSCHGVGLGIALIDPQISVDLEHPGWNGRLAVSMLDAGVTFDINDRTAVHRLQTLYPKHILPAFKQRHLGNQNGIGPCGTSDGENPLPG
jgi:hypothetical protein